MKRYTTLTQFIDNQIERFDIPNTEKNQMKLRVKFTRKLKQLGFWENAKTKIITKTPTKIFTQEQLQLLYKEVEPYLLKRGSIDPEELEAYRSQHKDMLENPVDYDDRSDRNYIPYVSKKEAEETILDGSVLNHKTRISPH